MRTTMTTRHCEISDELKTRANTIVGKLTKVASRVQNVEIIFDADHGAKVVEIMLTLPRGQVKVAKAEERDFRTALDRAADKIKNQLHKDTRRRSHGSTED